MSRIMHVLLSVPSFVCPLLLFLSLSLTLTPSFLSNPLLHPWPHIALPYSLHSLLSSTKPTFFGKQLEALLERMEALGFLQLLQPKRHRFRVYAHTMSITIIGTFLS